MGSFVLLGEFVVPPKTYLAQGACNPEKDLVLLVHRSESRDTLSLWKLQGSKRWEIDVVGNFEISGSLRHVSWSPDGDKFALGHSAKRVTVHDVLDGCEEFRYNDASSVDGLKSSWKIASLAWLKMPWKLFWNEDVSIQPPPQLYPREYDAPGSAFYVFKQLPQLDYKVPLVERLNEEGVIADSEWFRRPTAEPLAVHRAPRYMFPPSAHNWPSLPFNLAGASIMPSAADTSETPQTNDPKDRWYVAQSNTCLFAGDNHGGLYPFIHGTYLAGTIETKPTFSQLVSIVTGPFCLNFTRLCIQSQVATLIISEISGRAYSNQETTEFASSSDYKLRDILRISTAAKDLALYASRNCGEAEIAWMGGGGQEGAREWNRKWCRLLDSLQSRQGDENSRPKGVKTDLTFFLLTGVPLSATLSENLEHGSQTTERNFKKWHGVVHESLMHIKHLAEISLLSLQRLIALLWDLLGMAEIKSTARDFMLDREAIHECIEIASAAVEVLALMADVTRKEIQGFAHFMIWLRGLIPNLPPAEAPLKSYDILVVNNYIANGLHPSGIDDFFEPRADMPASEEVKKPTASPQSFHEAASRAHQALRDLRERKKLEAARRNGSPSERRIRPMITSLMMKCNTMFQRIASSISASSEVYQDVADVPRDQQAGLLIRKKTQWKQIILPQGIKQSAFRDGYLQAPRLQEMVFREKLIAHDTGVVQYVLVRIPGQETGGEGRGQRLCIIRLTHTHNPPKTQEIACAMFDLAFPEEADSESERMENEEKIAVNLLDAQFYDDQKLVLVLQTVGTLGTKRRAIALFNFVEPEYHPVSISGPSVEMEEDILQRFAKGSLPSQALTIASYRVISMRAGASTVSLAVNSKRGVAVLLDHERCVVQSYDLANEEEEEDANQDEHESLTPTEQEESMEIS